MLDERSPDAQKSRVNPVPLNWIGACRGGLPHLETPDSLKAVAIAG
jgi:hypothetical protein